MFTYSCLSIDSAIPIQEIYGYFAEIGVKRCQGNMFAYHDLEIEVTPSNLANYPSLNITRHAITVQGGERSAAESFLTDFRMRFLSAGG